MVDIVGLIAQEKVNYKYQTNERILASAILEREKHGRLCPGTIEELKKIKDEAKKWRSKNG